MIPIEQTFARRTVAISDPELRSLIERELLPIVSRAREIINEGTSVHVSIDSDAGYAWHFARHGILFVEFTAGCTACEFSVNSDVVLRDLRPGRRYTLLAFNDSGGNVDVTFGSDISATPSTLADQAKVAWEFIVTERDWSESRIEQVNCRCP